MKFKIESATWYKVDEMIAHYPCLAEFGFEVEKKEEPRYCKIQDEMGSPIQFEYATKVTYTPYVNIHSLEDLVRLIEKLEIRVVVDVEFNLITIYDGYLE